MTKRLLLLFCQVWATDVTQTAYVPSSAITPGSPLSRAFASSPTFGYPVSTVADAICPDNQLMVGMRILFDSGDAFSPGGNLFNQGGVRAAGRGAHVDVGNFTFRPLHTRPEAAIVVIQTSFDIQDANTSNNNYGFSVSVQ